MTGDFIYLQTFDGEQLYVPEDEIRFLTYGNFGAPPVDFITRRGYRQHGETEVSYQLNPRTISVELWRSAACTRQKYWDNRLALHEFLRHNRNGPIQFVLRQPNGNKRALMVRADPGLGFPMPGVDENSWEVNDVIDFVAFDPVWFDPDENNTLQSSVLAEDLVFPITFPIRFGVSSYDSSIAIVYPGTWVTYPTITLYGPYTTAILENLATGVRILLTTPIAGGDIRVISLQPGRESVIDSLGHNKFSDLSRTSDLTGFNIRPNPEVAGGIQTIKGVFIGGAAGTSAMRLQYNDRYFAL